MSESLDGQPLGAFLRYGQCLEHSLEMVVLETSVSDDICRWEWPESRRERMQVESAEAIDFMMMGDVVQPSV